MNAVNGGDTVFCVCAQQTGQSDQWKLNANGSKTIKASDFKFGRYIPTEHPDITT